MKKILFLLVACTYPCSAGCGIPEALQALIPGAQWVLQGTDYSGLQWLDKVQAKPTEKAISDIQAVCQASLATQTTQINSAKGVLANAVATTDQKVNAVITILKAQGQL